MYYLKHVGLCRLQLLSTAQKQLLHHCAQVGEGRWKIQQHGQRGHQVNLGNLVVSFRNVVVQGGVGVEKQSGTKFVGTVAAVVAR